ncbi:uncharacterized protein METZ01_LOCUS194894 [marine metagenome]|uniref:Sodium symporter small subunit domain-containing protein n=1 Tax=marine metagenome TaxID=408172 RepID=A0A382DUC9_9ZZZZ
MSEENSSLKHNKRSADQYWKANLRLMGCLLVVWFAVSYGCGILFVDQLDGIRIGGFKLGFWFAQQGSIYVFVALIFFYVWKMNKIDREFDLDE